MDTPMPSPTMNAEVYLAQLANRGVEYVFANAGTDFAPIIEALAGQTGATKYPRFIIVPHENLAMSMAYGYYRATGKIAAVMCHVSVGTANTVCGLMNAARDNIPILLAAGRTPLTETGHIASRDRQIHWGQECFDQGNMVREFVKWDYELRAGQPVDTIVDRALDIAMSEPRGPVYLTLPRETLADSGVRSSRPVQGLAVGAAPAAPDHARIEEAAKLIAGAKFPLIITSSAGLTTSGFHALASLTSKAAIPVVQQDAYTNNLPSGHEMNLGYEMSKAMMEKADVILVIESKVPWSPQHMQPKASTKVIHIAPDPLMSGIPFHGFKFDLAISGSVPLALPNMYEPSPTEVITSRLGAPSLAPSAAPSPKPRPPARVPPTNEFGSSSSRKRTGSPSSEMMNASFAFNLLMQSATNMPSSGFLVLEASSALRVAST